MKTLAAILTDEGHVVHTVTHGALVDEAIRRFTGEIVARSVGFDHFFRKPADPAEICDLLQEPRTGPGAA